MNLTSTRRIDARPVPGRALWRAVTVLVALAFSVVGLAAPSMAHHNTITGTVACKAGGGWTVTWKVVNSEQRNETITASNRTVAVPVGTVLGPWEARVSTETITTKPTSTLVLTVSGRWTNGATATNSGGIPVSAFSDSCIRREVPAPQVPVIDDCGPNNARYGTVPAGPWTVVVNPNRSLTLTAHQGYTFPNGQTTITYPVPVDSAQPCPPPVVPPVVVPPVVVPPVVTPPTPIEVLPAELRVVRAKAEKIDKCGRESDLYKVAKRDGVDYRVGDKVIREGVWLRSKQKRMVVRAFVTDETIQLAGKGMWRFRFSTAPCAPSPQVLPATGS